MHNIGNTQVDTFTWSYITALFWTTSENEFPEYCYSGEFGINEGDALRLTSETLTRIIDDCGDFQDKVAAVLGDDAAAQINAEQAGHDFAMERNGCGVGFWDRDVSVYGDRARDVMHDIAQTYNEFELHLDDNGLIYGA